jgi:chromosome partitioning protein
MDGLDFTLNELDRLRKNFNLSHEIRIVWNRYDARERLGIVYMHELAKTANKADKILPVVIRTDVSVKNAIFDARSIFDMPKKSTIREDVDQFTREVLGINEWKEAKQKAVA